VEEIEAAVGEDEFFIFRTKAIGEGARGGEGEDFGEG